MEQNTPQTPKQAPTQEDPVYLAMQREIESLKSRVSETERLVTLLSTSLNNPRVRIQNFEGVFKSTATAPSNGDDYQSGSILMYFDGATTYRIYAKINKTWRYATLT